MPVRAIGGGPPGVTGAVSAATLAALEVSKAVSSNGVQAPDASKSFVALDEDRRGQVDSDGLPEVYDKDLIQKYWDKQVAMSDINKESM